MAAKMTSDQKLDSVMKQMVAGGADSFHIAMVNGPVREFVRLLDQAHLKSHDPEATLNAIQDTITSVILETVARLVPKTDAAGAQALIQQIVNEITESLSFELSATYGPQDRQRGVHPTQQ